VCTTEPARTLEAAADLIEHLAAMSPATAPALVQWLRNAARREPVEAEALSFARALLER
jgi:hypothetical protein